MQIVKQILILVLASVILMALLMPLAQTDWADSFRTGSGEATTDIQGENQKEMPLGIGAVAGFIKELVIMGIPMLITLGVLRLTKGRQKTQRA